MNTKFEVEVWAEAVVQIAPSERAETIEWLESAFDGKMVDWRFKLEEKKK